jgi:putative FmdB family regulatory protein
MPMYEFQCPRCKQIVEKLVRSSSDTKVGCELCKVEMEKIISSGSFKFRIPPT